MVRFESFLKLQNLELEILRVEQAIKKLREEEKGVSEKIHQLKRHKEELLTKRQEVLREISLKEEEAQECLKRAKRAEERLNFVKKAEEYKALLREKAKNEDCAIKLRKAIEGLRGELRRLEEELKSKREENLLRELEEELEDIHASLKRNLEKLEELRSKKESLLLELDRREVQEYETLKKKYSLPFMVKVDDMGACEHCGTKLPSALYSRVIKGETLTCPFCGRLLYHEEIP